MLSDSPSNYYEEEECTRFIAKIPTTWDETKVLEAKISDYVLIARRKGENWYVGGMTDATERNLTIDFSFLDKESNYRIEWIEDGANSDRMAKDYKRIIKNIGFDDRLKIEMHSGGGWVAILTKIK